MVHYTNFVLNVSRQQLVKNIHIVNHETLSHGDITVLEPSSCKSLYFVPPIVTGPLGSYAEYIPDVIQYSCVIVIVIVILEARRTRLQPEVCTGWFHRVYIPEP